jgi:hypothetical protein
VSDPLAVLQLLRESRPRPVARAGERCEVCTEPIGDEHGHLVDLEARRLLCACRGCYLLFTPEGAGGGHYRAVPDRYLAFPDVRLSRAQWEALQIPVSVAFFFVNSTLSRVAAFYPSPAGATESLLPLDTWDELVAAHPALSTLEPDVEALLVRARPEGGADDPRGDDRGAECFLVPIDACYELVGHLRRLWRGFDGGREAHEALDAFFDRVRARARQSGKQ